MKKQLYVLVAVIMAASMVLAGCGAAATTAAPATQAPATQAPAATATMAPTLPPTVAPTATAAPVTGNIIMGTNMTNLVNTTLQDLATSFMQANPGIKVTVEAFDNPATELQTRLAANDLPDVTLVLQNLKSTDYPNYFVPLDDLGFTKDNLLFYSNGLGPDNHLYVVSPKVIYYEAVVYNKKVFAAAGITSMPKTIDDLFADCALIKAKGITCMASNFKDQWPLATWTSFAAPINSNNPDYMNSLTKTDTPLSDDNGLLTMMKVLRTFNQKGYLEPDLMSTSWNSFYSKDLGSGKVAMSLLGPWLLPYVVQSGANAADLGSFIFPFPNDTDPKGTVMVQPDWYFAVSKTSKSIPAAKLLLKYLVDDANYSTAVSGDGSPLMGTKSSNPFLPELLNQSPTILQQEPNSDLLISITNKAQIDWNAVVQEYVTSSDPAAVVTKYNNIWAAARKAVGGG